MHNDVFSFGVVVWEMLTRQHPHPNIGEGEMIVKAVNCQLTLAIHESTPKVFKELLRGKLKLKIS